MVLRLRDKKASGCSGMSGQFTIVVEWDHKGKEERIKLEKKVNTI